MSKVFEGDIIRSENDKERQYRYVTLSNDLQVLLVSHPDTEKAAACCDVRVGSFQDPKEMPGLAHFLEHMLFMGTDEYPVENIYSKFLSENGGFSNAYTSQENTVYYFDVLPAHLEEALSMFSSFFKCPLFDASSSDREMKAVDSENSKNLQNDDWRDFQLLKSFAREGHPFNSFSTGNLETLGGVREEKESEGEKGEEDANKPPPAPAAAAGKLSARDECIAFHKKYYSANIMKVTIYGSEDLDTLQKWAEDKFSKIENKAVQPSAYAIPSDPYPSTQLAQLIKVVPVKDVKVLQMHFPLPSIRGDGPSCPNYHTKPLGYLSHLLGHEADGSILAALKERNLADSLSSYTGENFDAFSVMSLHIELTQEGLENVEDVVSCVYAYIGMLQRTHTKEKLPEIAWIAEELGIVRDFMFRFKSFSAPSSQVVSLANDMQEYPPEHVLCASHLTFNTKETQAVLIDKYLPLMTVANSLVVVKDKSFDGSTDKQEQWYKTNFSNVSFSTELGSKANSSETLLTLWEHAQNGGGQWQDRLKLPVVNELLPTDFSLRYQTQTHTQTSTTATTTTTTVGTTTEGDKDEDEDKDKDKDMGKKCSPELPLPPAPVEIDSQLDGQGSHLLWHRPDGKWRQPKIAMFVRLQAPALVGVTSPLSFALGEILAQVLDDLLMEYKYYASCACMDFNIRTVRGGLLLSFSGYSHKMPELVSAVTKKLKELSDSCAGDGSLLPSSLFERVKDKQLRDYNNNADFCAPYMHAIRGTAQCMQEPFFHPREKAQALKGLSLQEFKKFCSDLVSSPETSPESEKSEKSEKSESSPNYASPTGIRCEAYVWGNATIDEAKNLLKEHVLANLACTPLSADAHSKPALRITSIPRLSNFAYRTHARDYNPDEPNSAIENLYIVQEEESYFDKFMLAGKDRSTSLSHVSPAVLVESILSLLAHIARESAFDQLRTKEQLGYIVFTGETSFEHRTALRFIVQSSVKDGAALDGRIESFLNQFYEENLREGAPAAERALLKAAAAAGKNAKDSKGEKGEKNASGEEVEGKEEEEEADFDFTAFVSSLIDQHLEKPHTFGQEGKRDWAEIENCKYNFEIKEQLVEILRIVTIEDVRSFWNMYIHKSSTHRRKISSQFFGAGTDFPSADTDADGVIVVPSPAAFKARHSLDAAVHMPK